MSSCLLHPEVLRTQFPFQVVNLLAETSGVRVRWRFASLPVPPFYGVSFRLPTCSDSFSLWIAHSSRLFSIGDKLFDPPPSRRML